MVGSLPSVVVALAVVSVTARVLFPLYRTLFTILAAYAIMFLPAIGLRASLAQVPVELEQAAASLGKSRPVLFGDDRAPVGAGAAAGMTLALLGILNELTATQMLRTERHAHLAAWASGHIRASSTVLPLCLDRKIVISLPLTWLLFLQSRQLADR